jgi:hypothetical protein
MGWSTPSKARQWVHSLEFMTAWPLERTHGWAAYFPMFGGRVRNQFDLVCSFVGGMGDRLPDVSSFGLRGRL